MNYDNVNNPKHYEVEIDGEKVNTLKMVQAVVRPITNGVVSSGVKDVLKYTIRAEKKNGLEDYKKARFYLDEIIKELEKELENVSFVQKEPTLDEAIENLTNKTKDIVIGVESFIREENEAIQRIKDRLEQFKEWSW